jgi:acyl-coenzyme A synthetase/AMP-(fatty) acid ligase
MKQRTDTAAALPLISHSDGASPIAWRQSSVISVHQFLHDVRSLADRLPDRANALNLCHDRYHFAVAFAASALRGQCTLLPGTYAPELIRRLQSLTPDLYCLADDEDTRERLPQLHGSVVRLDQALADPQLRSRRAKSADESLDMPCLRASQVVAQLFTSGTTGTPVPHRKTWGQLVENVRVAAARLLQGRTGWSMLGTVPAQHMYGIESTVLLPLHSGGLLSSARPFFPADVAAALEPLPRPRALISTPVHLRALIDSGVQLPALDLVVSATAPLPIELARAVEEHTRAPLLEIYGSTETGEMASRRTVSELAWTLWPGVELYASEGSWWARGGQLPEPTRLADLFILTGDQQFLLEGRSADLVNVAGKRSSLAYLSQQLVSIPGVLDGAFFIREDAVPSVAGVVRLAALAVAPGLGSDQITAALRERIDPVFLPRPLVLVEKLPRNDTGKLALQRLREIAIQVAANAPELFT